MGYWFVQVFDFIGTPIIALCISTLLAVYMLEPGLDQTTDICKVGRGSAIGGYYFTCYWLPAALWDLSYGKVVVGTLTRRANCRSSLFAVMIPFFVASVVRLIQGSATVAMITSASITAPILAEVPDVNMLFAAQAAAIGGFLFSYFNDSPFLGGWQNGGYQRCKSSYHGLVGTNNSRMGCRWNIDCAFEFFLWKQRIVARSLVPLIGLGIVFWVMRKK
jgi:hypothetical protein